MKTLILLPLLCAGALPALAQGFSPTLPFGIPKSARTGPAAPNASQARNNYYSPSNVNGYYRYSNPYRFYTGGAGYGTGAAPAPRPRKDNLDSNTLPSYQNSDSQQKDRTPPGY